MLLVFLSSNLNICVGRFHCLVFSVEGQRTPTISYISQEQIKDIGETVEFQCSVQYAQEYPVVWTKINKDIADDQLPLSHGSSLIIRDTRFALRYDEATSTFKLQVIFYRIYIAGFGIYLACNTG